MLRSLQDCTCLKEVQLFQEEQRRRAMDQQPLLRVKRRRHAGTALTLRMDMEGWEEEEEVEPENFQTRRRSAVWRRVSAEDISQLKRPFVDAVLQEDESSPTKKRRRLTIVQQPAQPPASSPYKVLSPVERLVDDSLQTVFLGERSRREHLDFVTLDERLMDRGSDWLAWCNREMGNLLHACALWDDTEVGRQLLQRSLALADAQDEQGRTPYEVADMAEHRGFCELLEAFGADSCNYVYDVYQLDEYMSVPDATPCELDNGVGYWDEEGRFLLEVPKVSTDAMADAENDDDEVDSNHEDWGGNDYPDEDWAYENAEEEYYDEGYGETAAEWHA